MYRISGTKSAGNGVFDLLTETACTWAEAETAVADITDQGWTDVRVTPPNPSPEAEETYGCDFTGQYGISGNTVNPIRGGGNAVPWPLDAGGDDARRSAEASLIWEAKAIAAGHRFLTVQVTEMLPYDAEEMSRVTRLSEAALCTGRVRSLSHIGNLVVIEIGPVTQAGEPTADDVITPLELLAHELNPGGWSIRRAAG